jgi:hypothetical protein
MNKQNEESVLDPNASASSPGGQPSSAPVNTPPPDYRDWREQRRAERWARREARWQRRAGRHLRAHLNIKRHE